MAVVIQPVRPPGPKRPTLAQLAQIGDAFANAARNPIFSARDRATYKKFAQAYFSWLVEEAPSESVAMAKGPAAR